MLLQQAWLPHSYLTKVISMLGTGKVSVPETSERRDVGAPGDPPPYLSHCALALSVMFTIHISRLRLQSFRWT